MSLSKSQRAFVREMFGGNSTERKASLLDRPSLL